MKLKIGDQVPDFTLTDQHGNKVRLADLRGRQVVLSFHPLAFTPVCTTQMKDLEKHLLDFNELHATALGLSIDSPFAKAVWAEQIGVKETPLLADFSPHGRVAEMFGLLRPEGFSERAVIIIDETGKVAFAKIYPMKEVPDIAEILAQLKK